MSFWSCWACGQVTDQYECGKCHLPRPRAYLLGREWWHTWQCDASYVTYTIHNHYRWSDIYQARWPTGWWAEASESQREDSEMAFVRKSVELNGRRQPAPVVDQAWMQTYPALWEFLTLRQYEDGSPRRTSTLTLFQTDAGQLGASLNDRDQSRALFAVANTVKDVFEALEEMASDSEAIWRHDRQTVGNSGRVKK